MTEEEATRRVDLAVSKMLLKRPWLASMLLNLKRRPMTREEAAYMPTMGVDGTTLVYWPDYVEELGTLDKIIDIICHEVLHCVMLHPYRRQAREPLRWNIACDMVVNAVLKEDGIEMPPGCIPPGPLDKLAEELYDKVKVKKVPMDVWGAGELSGDPKDGKGQGQAGKGALSEKDWRSIRSQSHGLEPRGFKRILDEAQEEKLDWKELLALFVAHARTSSFERTWMRISRRVPNAPGKKTLPAPNIAIVVDTSGSVDDALLGAFKAELLALLSVQGVVGTVIAADAEVAAVLEPGEEMTADFFTGGGGTDFRPAIQEAIRREVDGIVYLTDGYGTFPKEQPRVPVLWVLTNHDVRPPFGEVAHLE